MVERQEPIRHAEAPAWVEGQRAAVVVAVAAGGGNRSFVMFPAELEI